MNYISWCSLTIILCSCITFEEDDGDDDEIGMVESLQFNLNTIQVATSNFSDSNKLGEGGFGSVYQVR